MNRRSKEGFVLSALLHGAVVGLCIVLPMIDLSDRSTPKQFELVPMPPLAGQAGGGSDSAAPTERQFDFDGPDNPAPSKPRPKKPPTPTQTKPTPPANKAPKPTPTTPAPPKPTPKETPAPAMSYDDFVKKHGGPKPNPAKKPTPTGGSTGRVKGPRVDTDFSGVVRDSVVGSGSRYGSLTGTEMSALGLYIAEIKGRLKEAWPQPTELADTLSTNVEFTVSADGRIYGVRIAQSSGNRTYDQTVLAAFSGVGDVGPTPDGKSLQLRLTFRMNED